MILKWFVPVVRRTLPAVAMLLVGTGEGPSQFAYFACPQAGTRFTLLTSATVSQRLEHPVHILMGERQGFDCHIQSDVAGDYWVHAGLVGANQEIEWRAAAESLWPLKLGNKSHAYAQHGGEVWMIDYAVVAFDKVAARVGVFDAYKVVATLRVDGKPFSTTTQWWSPALSFTLIYQMVQGDNGESRSWEIAGRGESKL
jgi:hypothetical protein